MFLTAQYIATPNPKVCTSKKNFWSDEENYHFQEQVRLTTRLRDSDLKSADVILDMDKQEIVKCRKRKEDTTYETIFSYFQEHYQHYLSAVTA
jgi:hypothetical protein